MLCSYNLNLYFSREQQTYKSWTVLTQTLPPLLSISPTSDSLILSDSTSLAAQTSATIASEFLLTKFLANQVACLKTKQCLICTKYFNLLSLLKVAQPLWLWAAHWKFAGLFDKILLNSGTHWLKWMLQVGLDAEWDLMSINCIYFFRMSGRAIKVFTNQCKNLNLETLSYCSYIQVGASFTGPPLCSLLTWLILRMDLLQTSPAAVRTWTVIWDTAAQTIRISGQRYLLWLLYSIQ